MKWIFFTGFLVLLGQTEGYAFNAEATPEKKSEGEAIAGPIPLSRKVRSSLQDKPKVCDSGVEFRKDCNKCLCDNDGYSYSCTRIDCVAQNKASVRSKREAASEKVQIETTCQPGSVFSADCNACRCSADGRSASCTNEQCTNNHLDATVHTTEADPGFRCNPGEQFKRDCNDCTCSADGRSTFCTLRFCDESYGIAP